MLWGKKESERIAEVGRVTGRERKRNNPAPHPLQVEVSTGTQGLGLKETNHNYRVSTKRAREEIFPIEM